MVESGEIGRLNYAGAQVRKPLLAVSDLVAKGNMTIFDEDSFIIPSTAPELILIRQLIAQAKGKIPLHQEKGIYKLRNWELPSGNANNAKPSGFTRPGKM